MRPNQVSSRLEPLVSAIIPCYNQALYLNEAVRSVLVQTMTNLECIIVNDGALDNTREVAARCMSADPRVRYVEQANKGLAGARNRGLDAARGRYIQFLDADDLISPHKFRIQSDALLRERRWALAYGDFRYCSSNGTVSTGDIVRPRFVMEKPLWDIVVRWETHLSIPVHSFLFDSALFKETGIRFDENLLTHEDWDCWMRIFELEPVVIYSPGGFAVYRRHPHAMTRNQKAMWLGFSRAIHNQLRRFKHDPVVRELLREKLFEMMMVYEKVRGEALGVTVQYAIDIARRLTPRWLRRRVRRLTGLAFEKLGIDLKW